MISYILRVLIFTVAMCCAWYTMGWQRGVWWAVAFVAVTWPEFKAKL